MPAMKYARFAEEEKGWDGYVPFTRVKGWPKRILSFFIGVVFAGFE